MHLTVARESRVKPDTDARDCRSLHEGDASMSSEKAFRIYESGSAPVCRLQ